MSAGLVLALTTSARADGPLPRLAGPALPGPAHLQLILSGSPPVIVDVDTGSARTVPGVTTSRFSQVQLVPIAGGALAIVHQACDPCAGGKLRFATNAVGFRIGVDGSVERLGSGRSFLPSRNGTSVWVLGRDAADRCTLRLEPSIRPARAVRCGLLLEDGETGLRMSTPDGEVLLDARTARARPASGGGRVDPRDDYAIRTSGDPMLEEERLHLDHLGTRASRNLRWPSILTWYGGWAARPQGSLIALEFADPAYPGPAQAEDFWLLDPATRTFSHLPGFPAQVDLKFSTWSWLDDGRLVLYLQGGGRTVVGLWQPGWKAVAVVPVALPADVGPLGPFVAVAG